MATITVNRTVQVAHRLSQLPGKCQNIHGHSMTIFIAADGNLDGKGILEGIDFSKLKAVLDEYLHEYFDHHLLLNQYDDLVSRLTYTAANRIYPGVIMCPADPTVENLCFWIAYDMSTKLGGPIAQVEVVETSSNSAAWRKHLDDIPARGIAYAG